MGSDNVTAITSGFSVPEVARQRIGANSIVDSDRFKQLDYRQSHYMCTSHDWKRYDFDGRVINAGPIQQQPFISEQASYFVPLRMRRPSAPVRLTKTIVDSFTSLLFGEDKFPRIQVAGDADTEDFKNTLARASRLKNKFLQARALGGSTGTVMFSWCYRNGKPCVEVHDAKNCWVLEWEDRDELKPAWVTEIYRYYRDEYDQSKRQYFRKYYWYRRDWTMNEEVIFKPVPYVQNKEPDWVQYVDLAQTVTHGDGFAHVVWIQNIPTDDVDGLPDYHGLYDSCDELDMLNSVLVRGTTLNLDPTLVLKVDPELTRFGAVKKGSDNSLTVGETGSAEYLELGGQSVEAGTKLFQQMRANILEVAQCVIPDPNEIAASGTSSVAMKVIYRPMLAQAAVLRDQYGQGIDRLLDQMTNVARERLGQTVDEVDDEGNPTGEKKVEVLALPPRIEEKPTLDGEGNPTGEKESNTIDRHPGEGGETTLDWGDWFPLTPQDKAQISTTLSTAVGAKAFISIQTAAEEAAAMFGRVPADEWKRVSGDAKKQQEQDAAKMDPFAGGIGGGKPPGAPPFAKKPPPPGAKPPPPNPFAKKPAAPNPFAAKPADKDEEE